MSGLGVTSNDEDKVELLSHFIGKRNAAKLLQKSGSLNAIAKLSNEEFGELELGISSTKFESLRAAFKLGSALVHERLPKPYRIKTVYDIAALVREDFRTATKEQMRVISLNKAWDVISVDLIAEGDIDSISVKPRDLYLPAIRNNASAIAMVHNHPSGDPTPSDSDIKSSLSYQQAGRVLAIKMLDSIIMGAPYSNEDQDFISLRSQGHLPEP